MTRSKSWLIVAGAVLAVLLVAGGVYVLASDGGEPTAASGPGSDDRAGESPSPGDEMSIPETNLPTPTDSPTGPPSSTPSSPAQSTEVAVESYQPDGPTSVILHYYIGVPECYGKVETVEVGETAKEVKVRLLRTPPDDSGSKVCIDIANAKKTTIELEQPLGARAVVDVSTGRTLEVGSLAPSDAPTGPQ
ncbi:MAG: hypothetical protein GEU96_08635 [Propionibacteriales bacterium]|nr:hypothetical protein [Propionibacteriales bacterium]